MAYPKEQTEELKPYCAKLSVFTEGGIDFLLMERLRLPKGCTPSVCDALLCPVPRENYPSRLYLSEKVVGSYDRNWNGGEGRIGERNWFVYSWKIVQTDLTLLEILLAHMAGFTRPE